MGGLPRVRAAHAVVAVEVAGMTRLEAFVVGMVCGGAAIVGAALAVAWLLEAM